MIRPSFPVTRPYGTGKNRRTHPASGWFLTCPIRQSRAYPADQVHGASSVSDLAAGASLLRRSFRCPRLRACVLTHDARGNAPTLPLASPPIAQPIAARRDQ